MSKSRALDFSESTIVIFAMPKNNIGERSILIQFRSPEPTQDKGRGIEMLQ
jgi:hypothetical protein